MADTVFSIADQGLKLDSPTDVSALVEQLARMPLLKEVHLSGNTFGSGASRALSEALRDKQYLEICQFSDMFTGRLKDDIPLSLSALTSILLDKPVHTLDLSDNAFGPAGAEPLREYLEQTRSLQVLKLNNNGLGVHGGTIIAKALLDNHKERVRLGIAPVSQDPSTAEHPTTPSQAAPLRVFIAGRNRLENGSMGALSEAFRTMGTLEHVQMPQNGIRLEGVATLLDGLAHCPRLRVLDLQDNTFTRVGATALAKAYPSWPLLTTLHVGDCLLTAAGVRDLMTAMMKPSISITPGEKCTNTSIERLHLAFNEIDTPTAALLCDWLSEFGQHITLLELNGNCFHSESVTAQRIRNILSDHGHPDALDELDEMELDDKDDDEEDNDKEDDEDTKKVQCELEKVKIE